MARCLTLLVWTVFAALLMAVCLYPPLDLIVSGWFYQPGAGFVWADHPLLQAIHFTAVRGGWVLSTMLIAGLTASLILRKAFCGVSVRGWLFLLLTLALGLGVVVNLGLKDHWGRARPRAVVEFGGDRPFTPAWQPQARTHKNDSFVAGDGAFGFALPALAFLLPVAGSAQQHRSRQVFYGLCGVGSLFGIARIIMGAHFLSDVLFAALVMALVMSSLHTLLLGWPATRQRLNLWFILKNPS
ncbi:MAG: phosphatase PAP2 family protein [Alphaproteobacteria bacterium]|nr:phosphatase PAP2 family protein [Alphaproteobacteria bacterium]